MSQPGERPTAPQRYPFHTEDFPYQRNLDNLITRREYLGLLTLTSFGLFVGTALLALRTLIPEEADSKQAVVAVDAVPEGESFRFHYPTSDDPALLVHLPGDRFVAYSQICTHLACAVLWDREGSRLECPCHEGFFEVETGRPLAGPPLRPLTRIALQVENGTIFAMGRERA